MSTQASRCQINATMLLDQAESEMGVLSAEIDDIEIIPEAMDMDLIYSLADQIKSTADRLNYISDHLLDEYRRMEYQEYCTKELDNMLSESYAH